MRRTSITLAVVAAFAAIATSGQAQAPRFGFEVAGLYATLSGSDFEGTDAGTGFDIQARFMSNPRFSLGAGLLRTSHGTNISDDNIAVLGFFAEPRYHFKMSGSSMSPYLTARLGYLKETLSAGGSDFEAQGNLFGFGGGMGYAVSPTVSLGGSVTYNLVNFGDAKVDGSTINDSSASGSSLAVRFSVAFAFK